MKTTELAALRYACRRGMLELDLMLNRFWDQKFPALSEEQQQSFVFFLQESDQQLWDWLRGEEIPERDDFSFLVKQIRS